MPAKSRMTEQSVGHTNNVVEKMKGQVKSWSELKSYIPGEVKPEHLNFLEIYCRVQLRISEGRNEKAKEILSGLAKRPGFLEYERKNQQLFAAIDVVVRGSTNRQRNLKYKEPAFIVK